MQITPFVLGSGRAAEALKKSLYNIKIINPELKIADPIQLKRGQSLQGLSQGHDFPILLIANPHGLHAKTLLEADQAFFKLIVVEKPAAVSQDEVRALKGIKTPVAVCHGYRQSWGIQTLKKMNEANEFGDIIAIEGRYWQSSAAQRALKPIDSAGNWKNNTQLSGHYDVLLDIGCHWLDSAMFLLNESPSETNIWLSYANSEAAHRDTHVHLSAFFESGPRLQASISKTYHGATNEFEIHVIGSKKSAKWEFQNPDQITLGSGSSRSQLSRSETNIGSHQSPFHSQGWLEGYIEILHQALTTTLAQSPPKYPTLKQHLNVLETLFSAHQEK